MTTADAVTSKGGESLRRKVAAVTSAARGIGHISAPVDPRSGVKLSTPENLEGDRTTVRAAVRGWPGIKLDQRVLPALRAPAVRSEQKFGGINIWFVKARIRRFHPVLETDNSDWYITIDVILTRTANRERPASGAPRLQVWEPLPCGS